MGTATFMIMGDKCTRRCPFCDVGHGRPDPLDVNEPENLAKTIAALKLKYVVITSVDRDDLRDGGSQHFVDCITRIRELSPQTTIEILVPDFRGRDDRALEILKAAPPDVMNHNLETAPRLYKEARPGSDYQFSLNLLKKFKALHPDVPTKSGIMVGLGETDEEILQVMRDMRAHHIDMLTIGQYLAPSTSHLPVRRYVHPDTFKMFEAEAYKMGFTHAAVGAMVRSSYHADQQAHAAGVADTL
jgi:lipoic acid synthetase